MYLSPAALDDAIRRVDFQRPSRCGDSLERESEAEKNQYLVHGALSNSHRRPLPRWHDWSGIHHQRRLGQESCRVEYHDCEEQVARQHNRERSRGALHERVE